MNSAIQIIDENKNFRYEQFMLRLFIIFRVEELTNFFKKSAALTDSSSPVVAVFGSQSSGKSKDKLLFN